MPSACGLEFSRYAANGPCDSYAAQVASPQPFPHDAGRRVYGATIALRASPFSTTTVIFLGVSLVVHVNSKIRFLDTLDVVVEL
jgi:hypothetical protein